MFCSSSSREHHHTSVPYQSSLHLVVLLVLLSFRKKCVSSFVFFGNNLLQLVDAVKDLYQSAKQPQKLLVVSMKYRAFNTPSITVTVDLPTFT